MTRRRESWPQRCVELLQAIDPAYGYPVYILPAREARGIVHLRENVALTGPTFSRELQERLRSLGIWKGPGFCCLIDQAKVTDQSDIFAVALHEYSHGLLSPHSVVEDLRAAMGSGPFQTAIKMPSDEPPPLSRPWDQHGPSFIRLAIHLVWRTYHGTIHRPLRTIVFNNERYRLPGFFSWQGALGDEPKRLRDLPMDVVASMPPPPSYSDFSIEALAEAEHTFLTQKGTR